ncbi:hypothetical protein [Enterococcus sp. DIV0170]|uniref:hypothetical protein n=1 Tax=Enterococcus sp. DIV0170 TaxID=2774642 RepID=UPI003F28301F
MKKILFGYLILALLSVGITTPASASEITSENTDKSIIEPRGMYLRFWFKGIPPTKHKGMTRISYYKSQGGYIGVYSRN